MVRNVKGPNVTFHRKVVSKKTLFYLDILPSWLRVVSIIQSWIQLLCAGNWLKVSRRRNPPCNVEDNLHAQHIIIEDWFRGY